MHGSQTGKCSTAWGEHDFLSIKIILSFCSYLLSRNATLKHTPPYRLSGQNRIPFISDVFSWLNTIFHSHKWCVIIYIVTEIQQWCQQRMNHVQKAKKLHKLTSEKPVYCMEFARAGDAPLNKKQKITWNNLKCRTKWQLTTESYQKYINNMYVSPTHAYALRFAFPFFLDLLYTIAGGLTVILFLTSWKEHANVGKRQPTYAPCTNNVSFILYGSANSLVKQTCSMVGRYGSLLEMCLPMYIITPFPILPWSFKWT